MKNFKNYEAEKYADTAKFKKVEEGIYKTQNPYDASRECYVTSLTFEMEPESFGEEDGCPQYISQVPFEDLLDKYLVAVSDFYDDLNNESEVICYQEFMSDDIEDIRKLRQIIGKRFYARVLNGNGNDMDEDDEDEGYEEYEEYEIVIE